MAHGAGAPKNSKWMNLLANLIEVKSDGRIQTKRFNFSYMERSIRENKRIPPNKMPVLIKEWEKQISKYQRNKILFIGGKSMGARMATLLDFNHRFSHIKGIIAFGFPFHPIGKAPGDRISHLSDINIPCLFNHGQRDTMGLPEEIRQYKLSKKIQIKYIDDGNHDLSPRKKTGITLEDNLTQAARNTVDFIYKNMD